MMRLQEMIEQLSGRADDSDLLALLAASREVRLHNAALARELRDVIGALTRELHQRQTSVLRQSTEITATESRAGALNH